MNRCLVGFDALVYPSHVQLSQISVLTGVGADSVYQTD